jgi:hypothetical protein
MPFDIVIPWHDYSTFRRGQLIAKDIQRTSQSFEAVGGVRVRNVPGNQDCVELISGLAEVAGESR